MGNNQPVQNLRVYQTLPNFWRPSNLGEQLLVNTQTNQIGEMQTIVLNGSLNEELQRYEYRYQQNQNLVRVIHAHPQHQRMLCAGQDTITVVTEFIPYRLAEAHNLSLGEALYVLHEALIGFMEVHKFEYYVPINDQLIGFTPQGRTKIWLNSNFADNHPLGLQTFRSQMPEDFAARKMIAELFQIVEEHTVGRSFPSYFKAGWNPTNFSEAINLVSDYAAESGNTMAKQVTLPNSVFNGEATTTRTIQPTTKTITTTVTETMIPSQPFRTAAVEQQPSMGIVQPEIIAERPLIETREVVGTIPIPTFGLAGSSVLQRSMPTLLVSPPIQSSIMERPVFVDEQRFVASPSIQQVVVERPLIIEEQRFQAPLSIGTNALRQTSLAFPRVAVAPRPISALQTINQGICPEPTFGRARVNTAKEIRIEPPSKAVAQAVKFGQKQVSVQRAPNIQVKQQQKQILKQVFHQKREQKRSISQGHKIDQTTQLHHTLGKGVINKPIHKQHKHNPHHEYHKKPGHQSTHSLTKPAPPTHYQLPSPDKGNIHPIFSREPAVSTKPSSFKSPSFQQSTVKQVKVGDDIKRVFNHSQEKQLEKPLQAATSNANIKTPFNQPLFIPRHFEEKKQHIVPIIQTQKPEHQVLSQSKTVAQATAYISQGLNSFNRFFSGSSNTGAFSMSNIINTSNIATGVNSINQQRVVGHNVPLNLKSVFAPAQSFGTAVQSPPTSSVNKNQTIKTIQVDTKSPSQQVMPSQKPLQIPSSQQFLRFNQLMQPLQSPPEVTVDISEHLDMISVPIIQILEYMPEKGIQVPQPGMFKNIQQQISYENTIYNSEEQKVAYDRIALEQQNLYINEQRRVNERQDSFQREFIQNGEEMKHYSHEYEDNIRNTHYNSEHQQQGQNVAEVFYEPDPQYQPQYQQQQYDQEYRQQYRGQYGQQYQQYKEQHQEQHRQQEQQHQQRPTEQHKQLGQLLHVFHNDARGRIVSQEVDLEDQTPQASQINSLAQERMKIVEEAVDIREDPPTQHKYEHQNVNYHIEQPSTRTQLDGFQRTLQANTHQSQRPGYVAPEQAKYVPQRNSLWEEGHKIIEDEEGTTSQPILDTKPFSKMKQAVSVVSSEDQRRYMERTKIDSAIRLPSTVVVDGEVYPYPKKIVSKYQTIIDESAAPVSDDYAAIYMEERHNTTIDKSAGYTNEHDRYDNNKLSKELLALEREIYSGGDGTRKKYNTTETTNYIPAADRYDIDEILRRYESNAMDTTIERNNYRRTGDRELYSTSSNITFGYKQEHTGSSDEIDRILSRYEAEKTRVYGADRNKDYRNSGDRDGNKYRQRYRENNNTKTYEYKQANEPIIIFTKDREVGRNSRVASHAVLRSSNQVSYQDLRTRLHKDEREMVHKSRQLI